MSIREQLFQWTSTITIQLSVLVYQKADLFIISLKINLFSPWYSWKKCWVGVKQQSLSNTNISLFRMTSFDDTPPSLRSGRIPFPVNVRYCIEHLISNTSSVYWNIEHLLSNTSSVYWNIEHLLSNTSSVYWNIEHLISNTSSVYWNIEHLLSNTSSVY